MMIEAFLIGSGLPRLEAEMLAAAALGRERTWIVAHGNEEIPTKKRGVVEQMFLRRQKGEPVAYIIGEREFYGRKFEVSPAVLIPRPSTEHLVESALRFLSHPANSSQEVEENITILSHVLRSSDAHTIVDIGTGSGCIAVTLALEKPDFSIIATDVSSEALDIARKNAETHGVSDHIQFHLGNLLEPVLSLEESFVIVANPPYVPLSAELPRDVKDFEPSQALFGGENGAELLRALFRQARMHPFCAGLVCECQTDQREKLLNS